MASGTSFALPRPTPTCPASSPTTTSAEKLKRRPPLTTFATRLMWMTRSLSFSSSICSNAIAFSQGTGPAGPDRRNLELEPALAGRVGERADAPVIEVTIAVEDDPLDVLRNADLGHEGADLLGSIGLVSLERPLEVLRERGRVRQGLAALVVDDLAVDVLGAAENG